MAGAPSQAFIIPRCACTSKVYGTVCVLDTRERDWKRGHVQLLR